MTAIVRNLRLGLLGGFLVGTAYTMLASLLLLLSADPVGMLEANEISFARLVLVYYAAGLVGGMVAGLLVGFATAWYRAVLVGVVAVTAAIATAIAVMAGVHELGEFANFIVIGGLLLGSVCGHFGWREFHRGT